MTDKPTTLPVRRSMWSVRDKPGRLALAIFRMPLRVYQRHPERMPARTFLKFVHIGRKTGDQHEAVAMVLRYDEVTREAVICAAWGPDTDWVRNLRAAPAVSVQVGRDSFTPDQRFLSDDEALDVVIGFRRAHPARLRLVSTILGWGDLSEDATARYFVRTHPFVAFRPLAGC